MAEHYIYHKNGLGEITAGGVSMTEFIKKENHERKMLGGGSEIGLSKFDGLAIPLGLHYQNQHKMGGSTTSQKIPGLIDPELFKKLFETVTKNGRHNRTKKVTTGMPIKPTRKTRV